MIEARICTAEEKLKNPNMDYIIHFGGAKRYFTKNAVIELERELKKLRLDAVSGQSEQFNCGKERVFREKKCDKQCDYCLKGYGSN